MLDQSHFSGVDLSDGTADFVSDKGYHYHVEITGSGSCGYGTGQNPESIDESEDDVTTPNLESHSDDPSSDEDQEDDDTEEQ